MDEERQSNVAVMVVNIKVKMTEMNDTHAAALGRVRLSTDVDLGILVAFSSSLLPHGGALPTNYESIKTACMRSSHLPFHTILSYASARCCRQSAAREGEQCPNEYIPCLMIIFHQQPSCRALGLVVEQRSKAANSGSSSMCART